MTDRPVNAIDLKSYLDDIDKLLRKKNLLKEDGTINDDLVAGKGKYTEIYQYVSDLISNRPILPWSDGYGQHADDETRYWFSKAPDVNADDNDSASKYIRGVTQWGLEFTGAVSGLSQEKIDEGMQKTSNMIGQLVIQELLTDKFIPAFDVIISKDITAAIGNLKLEDFVQTMGGWGGSFYYWDAHMLTSNSEQISAGKVIENGATVQIGTNGTSVQTPSIVEFYYANSNTSADFLTKVGESDVLRAVNDGSVKELVEAVLSIPNPLTIKDVWTSITTGTQAQAPDSVKKNLIKFTEQALLSRMLTSGAYLSSDIPPTVTVNGAQVTTTYSNGSSYTQDFSAADDVEHFTNPNGLSGTLDILSSGAVVVDSSDANGKNETLYINVDGTSVYADDSGDGNRVQITDSTAGVDTLAGGRGANTYTLDTSNSSVITDADGEGAVEVLSDSNDYVVNGSGANATEDGSTWVDADGTRYQFSADAADTQIGTLVVSGTAIGTGDITIDNFDLSQAQTTADGYLGIKLAEQNAIEADASNDPFNTGNYNPANNTVTAAGKTQGLTIYASAVSAEDQTVTLSLAGDAGNFAVNTGADMLGFSGGTVTLIIPAGQKSVTVGLVYTGDSALAQTAELTSTVHNQGDSQDSAISNSLTVGFAAQAASVGSDVISGVSGTLPENIRIDAARVTVTAFLLDNWDDTVTGTSSNDFIVSELDGVSPNTPFDLPVYKDGDSQELYHQYGMSHDTGGNGNNIIAGGGGQDIIMAGAGNNAIYADSVTTLDAALKHQGVATGAKGDLIGVEDGNNTIIGGEGNDNINVGSGNNFIVAGNGSDTISGGIFSTYAESDWTDIYDPVTELISSVDESYKADSFNAPADYLGTQIALRDDSGGLTFIPVGTGNDTIFGGTGDSFYELPNGNNYLDAGGGNDQIHASTGRSTIFGGKGNDTIFSGGGDNYIDAESGNDLIVGEGGNTTIFGGSGNDTIYSGTGDDAWATSVKANAYIEAGSGNTELQGSAGNDTLIGGSGKDSLHGGAGTEYLQAGSGDTELDGGDGNDTLQGGSGVDSFFAGAGHTVIYAGNGGTDAQATYISTGAGNTTVYGGNGVDHILGGSGTATIYAGDGGDEGAATVVNLGSGVATVYGGAGIDYMQGGSGSAVLYAGDGGTVTQATQITGGSGTTTIYGGMGVDNLLGGSGTTVIYAGDGGTSEHATSISGGVGSDTLISGAGTDIFYGGAGTATYLISDDGGSSTIATIGSGDTLQLSGGTTVNNVMISEAVYSSGDQFTLSLSQGGSVNLLASEQQVVNFADGDSATFAELLSDVYKHGAVVFSAVDTVADADSTDIELRGVDNLTATANTLNDLITANTGNDTLIAGTGNDTLVGGSGTTTYVIAAGAQTTTLKQSGSADVLTFGAGVVAADLSAAASLASDGSSVITLQNSLGGTVVINGSLDQIQLDDGSTLSLAGLVVQATSGVTSATSAVSVTLAEGIQNMTLTGSADLVATGNDQSNVIYANSGNDTLIAGSGETTLVGGSGATHYVVAGGTNDVVILNSGAADSLALGSGFDETTLQTTTQVVNGVTMLAITGAQGGSVAIEGGSLNQLTFANGDTISLAQLTGSYSEAGVLYSSVDIVAPDTALNIQLLAAGVQATGNGLSDVISGTHGNDTLVAGTGSDTLIGGGFSNSYVVGSQAGQTITVEHSQQFDTLAYGAGVTAASLSASAALGADGVEVISLVNTLGGTVEVTQTGEDVLDDLAFADGSSASLSALLAQATSGITAASSAVDVTLAAGIQNLQLTGTADLTATGNDADYAIITANSGNDTLIGGSGNDTLVGGTDLDTFVFSTESGDGTLVNHSAQGANVVLGATLNLADLSYVQVGADLQLSDATTGAQVTLTNYQANPNAWHITDGAGDSIPFVFTTGMGAQTLGSGYQGVTMATGITPADLHAARNGNDLILRDGTDSLTFGNWYSGNQPAAGVSFADGSVLSDTALSSLGTTFNFSTGMGQQVLAAGYATITTSTDILASSMAVSRAGTDLVLTSGSDSLTITGWYADPANIPAVNLAFADGTQWDTAALTSAGLVQDGSAGNVTLTGLAGFSSTLMAGNGDTLVGGGGSDHFVVDAGAENVTITHAGPGSTLVLSDTYNSVSYRNGSLIFTLSNGDSGPALVIDGFDPNDILGSSPISTVLVNNTSESWEKWLSNGFAEDIHQTAVAGDTLLVGTNLLNYIVGGDSDITLAAATSDVLDQFVAGAGLTTMIGGLGDEEYFVNNTQDVIEANPLASQNYISTSVSYVLPENVTTIGATKYNVVLTGNDLNDTFILQEGGYGNIVVTGTGIDTISDTTSASISSDVFYINNSKDVLLLPYGYNVSGLELMASVSYSTTDQYASLIGVGSADITLSGGMVTGNDGNDVLIGSTLVGGSGIDTMIGGTGDNIFTVTNSQDVIQANANASSNSLIVKLSNATYVLPDNFTSATLRGDNITIVGNSLNDTLTGAGNTLVAGSGIDTLVGGYGTTFVVNNVADVIQGTGGTIESSVSYSAGKAVELDAIGDAAITLTAGMYGTRLVAGSAATTLVGGDGIDVFVINNQADVIINPDGDAGDQEETTVSTTRADNVWSLFAQGDDALTLTGNSIAGRTAANRGADTLIAGSGADTLYSGTGVNTLIGGTGQATFVINSASDVIVANIGNSDVVQSTLSYVLPANLQVLTGIDYEMMHGISSTAITLTGNNLADTITANSYDDTLVAGSGLATLIGGTGNDTFVINNVGDVIDNSASYGIGTLQTSVSYVTPANIQNITGIGSGNVTLTGNTLANVITGNSGNDTLAAGKGLATLVGGTGNDTFVINTAKDVIVEGVNSGSNTEQVTFSTTLVANVQNLTATGTSAVTLTGNALANVITANSGADTLVSGTGIDTLVGGSGNDTFIINNSSDVITVTTAKSGNVVQSAVSYALGANLLNLKATGTANVSLTGNNLANTLTANGGNDTLVSGTGVTTLVGGAGNDVFIVNNASDVVTAQATATLNTVQSSVSYTAATNVTDLFLTGTGSLTATANAGNDLIVGNSGADTLVAGKGADVLEAGAGASTLKDTAGAGALIAGSGNDTLTGGTGVAFIAAGAGSDAITLGAGVAVVGFNKGDGKATIAPGSSTADVLSLGGGIAYSDLAFSKKGNNLVLSTGGTSTITFTNWYSSTANQDFVTLQVLEQSASTYSAASSNTLYNQKVEAFSFTKLVAAFNQALAATPSLTSWSLMNSLLTDHLSGSDTSALGGDLAYYDGVNGNVTGLNLATAVSTLQGSTFGKAAQTVDAWSGVSASSNKLH